ncbi:MAG: IS110 family transposase [Bacilli bacterium]
MKYGVGIDVSKGKSTVAILSIEGEVIEMPFDINHDVEDLEKLDKKLQKFSKEDLKIVLEQTGTYHLPILTYLLDKGYCVIAENALKIKKYLDRSLRKAKTDKKDSLKLAEYVCDNWYKLKVNFIEEEKYKELRFLSRQYFSLNSMKVQQKVDFSDLTDMLFPGYYQLLEECNFVVGLKIFEKFNDPEIIRKKKLETFLNDVEKIAQKIGQQRAGRNLAIKVYELAKKSVPSCPSNSSTQLILSKRVVALINLIETTNEIIAKMNEIAKSMDEYKEVRNMKGVGERLAPLLIAEIGDIRRFKNAGSLIAYAGIDSPPYQSGKYEATNRHISKRGNKYLRKTGFEVMQSIKSFCRVDCEVYDYIIKKEAEGKCKKSAKIAGLNKFLRQYYGILKKKYIELGTW